MAEHLFHPGKPAAMRLRRTGNVQAGRHKNETEMDVFGGAAQARSRGVIGKICAKPFTKLQKTGMISLI